MGMVLKRGAARRRAERPVREAARPREAGVDGGVISAALLLCGLGAIMIYSITAPQAAGDVLPPYFLRQGEALLAGALLAGLAAALPLRVWHALALPLWGATVLALVAVLAFGIETNGARRWLGARSAGLVIQPGEFAKFATVLAVVGACSRGATRASGVAPRRRRGGAPPGGGPGGLPRAAARPRQRACCSPRWRGSCSSWRA